jgi:peptide chain release factor 2
MPRRTGPPRPPGFDRRHREPLPIGYNSAFLRSTKSETIMEAERLNAIESSLLDLRTRAGELRGYL